MKCPKCNTNTVTDFPFVRMNPKGDIGIFWCEPCVKLNEPEFHKNEVDERSDVENTLIDMFYGKK